MELLGAIGSRIESRDRIRCVLIGAFHAVKGNGSFFLS